MSETNETLRPVHVVMPGRILERELRSRGWTQRDLAEIMDRPIQAINEIVRGSKQITPETAIELASALGLSPEFWLRLEAQYRLHLAMADHGELDQHIARRSQLYKLAPIAELVRRAWIRATDNLDELEHEVCGFLGISSLHETPPLLAHFRHGQVETPNVSAQIAWVRRVQQLGRQQQAARLDRERLRASLPELLRHMPEVEQLSRIPTLLNELGVRFVIVRHLPKTYIDGVVCDLDRHEPIIGLTLRYDRVDAFWFTLLHELAHIVLGHARFHLDNIDDHELNKQRQEQEANEQARNWLIDQGALAGFIARTRPFYARSKILQFAAQQQTHPGIVVGQLHYRQELPYTNLRALLVKVSPYLAQWVDGDRLREQSDETEGLEQE